jgi:hypothetical protein
MKKSQKDSKLKKEPMGSDASPKAVEGKGRNEVKRHFDLAAELASLPPATAQELPTQPVARVTLDADRLHQAAVGVRERLRVLPTFDARHIDELPILADGLTVAERAWNLSQATKKTGSSHDARARGEHLRNELVQSGRFLLRADPTAQQQLDDIVAGDTIPDLVQGLRAMAVVINSNAKLFGADDTVPRDAAQKCEDAAKELIAGNSAANTAEALARRNQIHHLLQVRVKEVRAAATYVFRKEPQRLAPFASLLSAAKRKKPASKPEGSPPAR